MIELPEGLHLADQMDKQLKHKKIVSVVAQRLPSWLCLLRGRPGGV